MVGIWRCHIPTLYHYVRFPPGGNMLGNYDDHDTIECDTAFDDDDDYDDDDDDGDNIFNDDDHEVGDGAST